MTSPLDVIRSRDEAARRRKQLLEQLRLLMSKALPFEAPRQEPAPTGGPLAVPTGTFEPPPVKPRGAFPLTGEEITERLGTGGLAYLQRKLPEASVQAMRQLTDAQLVDELGLPVDIRPAALAKLRADPINMLGQYPQSAQDRFNNLGAKLAALGGYMPSPGFVQKVPTVSDVDPYLVELMQRLVAPLPKDAPTGVVAFIRSLGGIFPSSADPESNKWGSSLWRIAFGDTAVPNPLVSPVGQVTPEGILSDPRDWANYLGHFGVLGTAGSLWRDVVIRPRVAMALGAASVTINSVTALWGHDTQFATVFRENVAEGNSGAQSLLNAMDASDYAPGVKGSLEILLDPILQRAGVTALFTKAIPGLRFPGGPLEPAVFAPGGILEGLGRRGESVQQRLELMRHPFAETKRGKELLSKISDIPRDVTTEPYLLTSELLPPLTKGTALLNAIDTQAGWVATHVWRPAAEFGQAGLQDWTNAGYFGVPKYAATAARAGARALGNTVGAFDPAAVATGIVQKLFLVYRYMLDEGPAKWSLLGSAPWEPLLPFARYDPATTRILAAKVKEGVTGLSNHAAVMREQSIESLLTNYTFENKAVPELLIRWRKSIDALYLQKVRAGLTMPDEVVNYSPRFVRQEEDVVEGIRRAAKAPPEGQPVGVPQTFQYPQKYPTAMEGIKAGGDLYYEGGFLEVWQRAVHETTVAIADKTLGKMMVDTGVFVDVGSVRAQRGGLAALKKVVNKAIHDRRRGPLTADLAEKLNSFKDDRVTAALAEDTVDALKSLRTLIDKEKRNFGPLLGDPVQITRGGPAFKDMTFPDLEMAKQVLDNLEVASNRGWVAKVRDWGDLLRQTNSTLDFSASFLQGLPTLFTRPEAWAKAMGLQFDAFLDSTARARYLSDPKKLEVLRDFLNHEGIMGTSEFTAAVARGLGPRRYRQVVTPFNRAFDTLGDVARLESYEALRVLARTPEELTDVANYVNRATGVFSTARLGVGPKQRAFEGFILFSPRYNRAGLALIVDAFKGGLRGDLARTSLTKFATFGLLSYIGISNLLGQDPKLDPRPVSAGGDGPDFMTWDIAGQKFGIGSWWLTITRLAGTIVGDVAANPDGFLSVSSLEKIGPSLARALRGRIAPLPASGLDLLLGSTYLGERLDQSDDEGWADLANRFRLLATYEGPRLAPISLQTMLQSMIEFNPKVSVLGIAAEEAGLRVFDTPMLEQAERIRGDAIEAMYGPGTTEDELIAGDADVPIENQGRTGVKKAQDAWAPYREWESRHRQDILSRGKDFDLLFLTFSDESDRIHEVADLAVNTAIAAFKKSGTPYFLDGEALQSQVDNANAVRYNKLDGLRTEARFAPLFEKLAEKNALKLLAQEIFAGDLAYLEYNQRLNAEDEMGTRGGDYLNPNGSFNFEARDALLAEITAKYGELDSRFDAQDIAAYLKSYSAYRGTRPPVDPLWEEWTAARDGPLTAYWNMDRTLWGSRADFADIHTMLTTEGAESQALEARYPNYRAALAQAKLRWRQLHPEMDAMLLLMGKTTQPASLEALRIVSARRQALLQGA